MTASRMIVVSVCTMMFTATSHAQVVDKKVLSLATAKKIVMRYDINAEGTVTNGNVFFDMTGAPGDDALDGIKVDQQGNLYVSGPGGLWTLSSEGKHLGTLKGPEHPHNLARGDDDGKTLYLAAQTSVYRIRLNIPGIRPIPSMK